MAKYLRALKSIVGVTEGARYPLLGSPDGTVQFKDDDGDIRNWGYASEGEFFTIESVADADTLATKRTQLATLTAEIAQLEAQLAEESRLKVGDYARVISTYSVDSFELEDIVRITDIDSTGYPFYGESPINGRGEWFAEESIGKITPEEARASLIAKIAAHFNPEGGVESRE